MRRILGQEYILEKRASRTIWVLLSCILLLIAAAVLSLIYGHSEIDAATVWNAAFHYNPHNKLHVIIAEIRLPRLLSAMMIGAFLALSGALMQALTRNPLAEPSLIGVSHGAAFALVITITLFPGISASGQSIAAMAGAGAAVLLVFLMASVSKGGGGPVKLVLAGVAVGMLLSSLTSITAMHFGAAKQLSFWYAGGLEASGWKSIKMLAGAGFMGAVLVFALARPLTLLNFGQEVTRGLGINVKAVNALGVLAILLLTGSSVAVSGTISFIGLIVPHISRMLTGHDYRHSLPVSALLGSLLLTLSDLLSRMVNPPYETPVGVITAVLGVPFFLFLVRSGRGRI
ncbi:FecCD family ABC transporter permease [Peribacillus kribbensis]|uniref:FecCD family ABC transporter permease n=1 Tax=Peribacillus kribbensis TaxID=356658 RepID=UPI0004171327|nr:iron ABC transporter permease [Peribacillus kribbensis]